MVEKLHYIDRWLESAGYLDMLINTVKDDLFPLRGKDQGGCTDGGAPHAISREFSCYVDYLGALYTGWAEWNKSSDRFAEYLKAVLGEINKAYRQHADLIREMYRNGPVHEFDPKVVFNSSGDKCGWLASVGTSPGCHDFGDGQKIQVYNLTIVAHPNIPKVYWLPVFTSELLDDLIKSINLFKNGVGDLTARVICWNRAVGILNNPVRFNRFVPPKMPLRNSF